MSEYESGADRYSVNAQQTRVSNNIWTPKVKLHFIQKKKKCGRVDSPECLIEVGHSGSQQMEKAAARPSGSHRRNSKAPEPFNHVSVYQLQTELHSQLQELFFSFPWGTLTLLMKA